jgi:D-alanyl-D-alanine carboxypeptidase
MTSRLGRSAFGWLWVAFVLFLATLAPRLSAAPYAAIVMDARTGEVFTSENADTPLHPASLTKMMTLYVAFQALARGEITLDTEVRISAKAANEPPSRLGLREGQTIRLRHLLRAAAVKSANDAATAIGEALAGSESAFAERMNATAAAMGMTNSHFMNMHGLTERGHYSTAHDMTILGRHLIYDFPQYYNLFSRRTADAGVAEVANTNHRFLDSYSGADGIKTGFTNAAGYNLVASAERGSVRIIATVFGGTSTANRNARVAELLDLGFSRARSNVALRPPGEVPYVRTASAASVPESANDDTAPSAGAGAGQTIRVTGQVQTAPRPPARPAPVSAAAPGEVVVADATATAEVPAADGAAEDAVVAAIVEEVSADIIEEVLAEAIETSSGAEVTSAAAPSVALPETGITFVSAHDAQPETLQALAGAKDETAPVPVVTPEARPAEIIMTAAAIAPDDNADAVATEVVTRVSTSGGRHWAITLGSYASHSQAERLLLQAAIAEAGTLDGALRRVQQRAGGFEATFVGLSREQADLACRRFQARGSTCFMMGEDG